MKKFIRTLFILHIIIGIGAMAGGLAAILDPQKPLGVSAADALKNSPFDSFLIPGLILFIVIGVGSIASAAAVLLKSRFQGYISSVFSWALVIWIIVQCIMLNSIHPLHIIFFALGAVEVILSTMILFQQRLFPTNLALNLYKKISKEL